MKNKKNIALGALVAVLGTSVAMGTSYALYQAFPEDQTIHIGANTNKDIELVVGAVTDAEGNVVTPDTDHVFSFDVGFNKTAESTYTQNIYAAKLSVTVTSDNAALLDGLVSGASKFKVDPNAEYYGTFWAGTAGEATFVAAEEGGSITASVVVPLDIETDLETKVTLHLGDDVTDENFATTIAEATYNIDINLTEPDASFVPAYIVGSMADSGWTSVDRYMMVPDPKNAEFMWMYETQTGIFAEGDQLKGNKRGDWNEVTQEYNTIWSSGENSVYGQNGFVDNAIIGWTGWDSGSLYIITR